MSVNITELKTPTQLLSITDSEGLISWVYLGLGHKKKKKVVIACMGFL